MTDEQLPWGEEEEILPEEDIPRPGAGRIQWRISKIDAHCRAMKGRSALIREYLALEKEKAYLKRRLRLVSRRDLLRKRFRALESFGG